LTVEDISSAAQDPEKANNQGDIWTFMAVLPDSGFIHTVHTSKRNAEEANTFIAQIKEKSDQQAPLFHSDSWFYENVLIDNYCTLVEPEYKGRGRKPTKLVKIPDPNLRYVQVHKERNDKGKIEKISTRIVLGDIGDIFLTLDQAERCKTINTDYVESRNGKFRKDDARLIRRTLCFSKKADIHKAQIAFLAQVFNYTRTVHTLKILENSDAKKFQTKFKHRTPAMAQKLTEKVWSIKELLCKRPEIVIT
jgi:hypothetical protein